MTVGEKLLAAFGVVLVIGLVVLITWGATHDSMRDQACRDRGGVPVSWACLKPDALLESEAV